MHALSHMPRTFHPYSHWLKFEPCPHVTHDHHHGHPRERSLFTLISSLYFPAFLLSFFLSPCFYLSDEQQPELSQKIMENLRYSATNGGEGTYDVLYLPQVMSPRPMTSTSSRTHRSPSPTRSLPRTRTWMT